METFTSWPSLPFVALAVPVVLALAALTIPRRADLASGAALSLAVIFTTAVALSGHAPAETSTSFGVRIDAAPGIMLLLVASLGTVIVRYSRTYLHGEAGLVRYLRFLLLTLSAVTALVITGDLLVIALSWTATSLALHQLLTFHTDRPAALVAAHKKFLVSRLADVCLAASLALVHAHVGSFDLERIATWIAAQNALPFAMKAAAVLLVIAVALRSAQLPFHGWITQVMEAPTPVSALLHAGVVNIGGFVLIRLAPWLAEVEAARLLLVTIGLVSAVVAALVMTTRVSVKVALAWSTCAQMGFMLVQCGLGLWPLALLHLVAHSLYKAYAFLSAGSVVDEWRIRAWRTVRRAPSGRRLGIATVAAAGCALLGAVLVEPWLRIAPSSLPSNRVLVLLVGLSLVPLLANEAGAGTRMAAAVLTRALGVVVLYFGWHALAGHLVVGGSPVLDSLPWTVTAVGFVVLFALNAILQLRPEGRVARALHPWLFSGLYLDELFTRITFRVWPPRLPRRSGSLSPVSTPAGLEVAA